MSAQYPTHRRKTYTMPVLRPYGSVVATTRGSTGNKNDAGGAKKVG